MFGTNSTIVRIDGMRCEHCASRVKTAVSGVSGVKGVSVDLAKKTATIKFKGEFPEADVKKAIEELGFVYAGKAE